MTSSDNNRPGEVERATIAAQLSEALANRSESRFNAIAFLYRHEIIAALKPLPPRYKAALEGLLLATKAARLEEQARVDRGEISRTPIRQAADEARAALTQQEKTDAE